MWSRPSEQPAIEKPAKPVKLSADWRQRLDDRINENERCLDALQTVNGFQELGVQLELRRTRIFLLSLKDASHPRK